MRRLVVLLLAATTTAGVAGAQPWPTTLFLAGNDTWRQRAPIDLHNTTAAPVAGSIAAVPIGKGAGQLDLVGARARDLRVAATDGTEQLFDLRGPNGRIADGPIPAGATLIVPATAAAGATQRLFVYWDHPDTYPVPDYLAGSTELANGSFEAGDGATPDGWELSGDDAAHHIARVTQGARSGTACVRCEVAAGAESTWIAARQSKLALTPGSRYVVRGWVKAQNVVGRAGYYIHVMAGGKDQAINQVVGPDGGTFDWRQVEIPFTAPADAESLSLGTVLFGTGTAWYDDVTVTSLDPPKPAVVVTVGTTEKQELTDVGLPAGPWTSGGRTWDCRADAIALNPGAAVKQSLVALRVTSLMVRLKRGFNENSVRVVDPLTRLALPTLRSGDHLLFLADVPAHSRVRFAVCFSANPAIGPGPQMTYDDLVKSPGNLITNPSFEQGNGPQAADWLGGTEGQQEAGVSVARVRGGKLGDWAGRISVPAAAEPRWVGWRKAVPVEPDASYFVGAYIRTRDVTGGDARIWSHYLDAKGEWSGSRGWTSGTGLSGTHDWELIGGLAQIPTDIVKFELHLTMNCRGTIDHDGVVLCRAVGAGLGPISQSGEAGGGLRAWSEDPVIKVFRDTPAPAAPRELTLAAARGEKETLQLCLRSGVARTGLKMTAGPLRQGPTNLPPATVDKVGYVPVLQPGGYFNAKAQPWERLKPGGSSRTDGWFGWWPDYLLPIPDGAFDLAAGETQPLWITYSVPRGTPPGEYRGSVTVAGAGVNTTLPVRLTVWPQTLPEKPSLQVIYDMHRGGDRDAWVAFMADHKVSPDHVEPAPVFKWVNGHVTLDTTLFDKAATRQFDELKCSAAYWPDIFYACGWAYPPRDFLGFKYTSPEYKQALQEAVKLFAAHLKERGWFDRMSLYISDEPHYTRPEVTKWLGDVIQMIREAEPDVPVYSSTWTHNKAWDGILNHWGVGQYGSFPTDEMAARHKAGDKIWFTTDGQMEIDTPYCACERLLPWYCFAHDVSGYEFWGVSWYTYNPYKYGWHSFIRQSDEPGEDKAYWIRYPNGDGYLAYPGELVGVKGPVSSIRLDQARDGVEDYELFRALAAVDKPAIKPRAAALLAKVRALMPIPNAGGYRSTEILPDPTAVSRLRLEAGTLLAEAQR